MVISASLHEREVDVLEAEAVHARARDEGGKRGYLGHEPPPQPVGQPAIPGTVQSSATIHATAAVRRRNTPGIMAAIDESSIEKLKPAAPED